MTDLSIGQNLVRLAEKAGRRILDFYKHPDLEIIKKKDDSPVTSADFAAHEVIAAGLEKIDAKIPLMSEEGEDVPYETRRSWRSCWIVDPLDGTKEFIGQTGEFSVNIALWDERGIATGVIHVPVTGETYIGMRGRGAYRVALGSRLGEWQKLILLPWNRDDQIRMIMSRGHAAGEREAAQRGFPDAHVISQAGSAIKFCLLARGDAHLYYRLGTAWEWDIAAGQGIIESAGGSVTDWTGRPLEFNQPHLAITGFVATSDAQLPWVKLKP